jgi:serine/threonine protein phosphatase 1
MRVYCVGDIHGRADLLEELHAMILADSEPYGGHKKVIYLGDYIDRGQYSKQVIGLLLDQALEGFESIFLRGNHEQALLDFLEYPDHAANWLNFGGLATLLSYGVQLNRIPAASDLVAISVELRRNLPGAHLDFLNRLPLRHREGSYGFVHAGIRPGIPLAKQDAYDLLWIRDEFTGHALPHECIIVHGHSVSEKPELLPNRIGIDTGACYTGLLTCLVLEGRRQRFLQTGGDRKAGHFQPPRDPSSTPP